MPRWFVLMAVVATAVMSPQMVRADLTYDFIAQIVSTNSNASSLPEGISSGTVFTGSITFDTNAALLSSMNAYEANYAYAIKNIKYDFGTFQTSSDYGTNTFGNSLLLRNDIQIGSVYGDSLSAQVYGSTATSTQGFFINLSTPPSPNKSTALTSLELPDAVSDLTGFNNSGTVALYSQYSAYNQSTGQNDTLYYSLSSNITSFSLRSQPVALPEPSGWGMMALGAAAPFAIGMWMRRRANAAAMAA